MKKWKQLLAAVLSAGNESALMLPVQTFGGSGSERQI